MRLGSMLASTQLDCDDVEWDNQMVIQVADGFGLRPVLKAMIGARLKYVCFIIYSLYSLLKSLLICNAKCK